MSLFPSVNHSRFILGAVTALSLGAIGLRAQSYTWTGGGPGTNWSTVGNWDIGIPPNAFASNAFFGPNNPTAFTATVDSNDTVGTATITANAGAFTLASSGASTLTVDTTFFTYSPNAVAINAAIVGTGNFFMFGTGTVTFNSANTYSGITRVTSGTLADAAANSFSPNSVLRIASPGIVDVNFNETVAGLSDDILGGDGSVVIASGATLFIAGNNFTTFSGAITGNGGIEMDSTGQLSLSGANTYSGTTNLNAGTVADLAPGSYSPNSLYTLSGSASIDVNYNETIGGLEGGGGTVYLGSGATLNDATLWGPTYSGTIIGQGSLIIGGTGTQTLSGMNTYSGGTTVQSELFVGSSTNGPPGSFTAGPVGTGLLTFEFLAELSPSANVTLANPIFLNDDTQYVDNDDGGPNNLTLTGLITGSSGFEWCTTGIFELTGANTFSGGIDMREGTLLLGSSTVGPPGAITSGPMGTGGLVLDNGTTLAAAIPSVTFANAIDLTGNTQLGAGSSDNNALNITGPISGSGLVTYLGGPAGSLTLGSANSYMGDTTIAGGTLIAGNSQAFGNAGNSVVLNGGGLSVASGVTISNAISTLGVANPISGTGTIATPVTVNGAVLLSPGYPLGNLTFSNGLTLATNGSISFNLYDANGPAGTGYNLLTVSGGTLALTANPSSLSFDLNTITISGTPAPALNFNAATGYSWMFATSASAITGFSAGQFDINPTGFANATGGGTFSISETGNNLFLNFTPVPEPSTWALIITGVFSIVPYALSRRRRRRMRA